ncbi:hypothetical protein EXS54_00300, partial [Patescibacteria group bacterium]|nr:hypothetical protein [Patescibacteria group bacterium]
MARSRKNILGRVAHWVSQHRIPIAVSLVVAIGLIASLTIFAAGPGYRAGGDNSLEAQKSRVQDRRENIVQQDRAEQAAQARQQAAAKQAKADKNLKKAEKEAVTAAANYNKQKKHYDQATEKLNKIRKQKDQAHAQCNSGDQSACSREKELLGQRAVALTKQATAKNDYDKANKRLQAAAQNYKKTYKNANGKNPKNDLPARANAGGSGGSGVSSSGGSAGGSGSSSGGESAGSSSGGSGNSSAKKAVPGSIQVTVLQQVDSQKTAKMPKVRVTVKPKCKASLKR